MEWYKCTEATPEKAGKLLVVINSEILFAEAVETYLPTSVYDDKIYYFIHVIYEQTSDSIIWFTRKIAGEWIKPKLYAEITHWMPLPKLPN